jgi:hypothetical protein
MTFYDGSREIEREFFNILDLMRKFRSLLDQNPAWIRASANAFDLYDLIIEQIETLIFYISEDHTRKPGENPEIRFSMTEIDSLGNPKSFRIKHPSLLAGRSDEEVTHLRLIVEELISLRDSQFVKIVQRKHLSEQTARPLPMKGRKRSKRSKRKKKRWFYIKNQRGL